MGKIHTVQSLIKGLMGLRGKSELSAYATRVRTKEVGIRKVPGASESSLVALLSKDLVVLVLIAIAIAWPVSWYAMTRWLEGFAFHASVDVFVFTLSGVAALTIAMLTVSIQAIKTAVMNPVKSLKTVD